MPSELKKEVEKLIEEFKILKGQGTLDQERFHAMSQQEIV